MREATTAFAAMGTVVDVRLWGDADAAGTFARCQALVRRLEGLLSRFRPDSDIAALGRSAGRWATVDPHTDAVLRSAVTCARATGGRFEPVLGALVDLWDVRGRLAAAAAPLAEAAPLPATAHLVGARTSCGVDLLERAPDGRYRLPAGAGVDLGGIAKGYTADLVRDLCATRGARGALVSLGTSSIAALGARPDGTPWRVGLRDPRGGPGEWVGSIALTGGSLSTSGGYGQALRHDGRLVHHVLDPRTGRPATGDLDAVTVLAPEGTSAEAWSTAMCVGGLAWSVAACARLGLEAVFLADGELLLTPGLRERVRRRRAVSSPPAPVPVPSPVSPASSPVSPASFPVGPVSSPVSPATPPLPGTPTARARRRP